MKRFVFWGLTFVCLGAAVWFGRDARLAPDRAGEAYMAPIAQELAGLSDRQDLLRFRLAKDPVLLNAVIWDETGQLIHPALTAFNHVNYELSETELLAYQALRDATGAVRWSDPPLGRAGVVRCQRGPDICVLIDREALSQAIALDLSGFGGAYLPAIATALAVMALIMGGFAFVSAPPNGRRKRQDGLELWPEHLRARRGALEIDLTQRDLAILAYLRDKKGAVATKDELYDAAWGRDFMPNSRALDQHIITLRRKLDPDRRLPPLIETVRGVGYRMPV